MWRSSAVPSRSCRIWMCAQTPVRDTMCDASSPPTVYLPYFNPPASTLLLHPFCFNPLASTPLPRPLWFQTPPASPKISPAAKFPLLQSPSFYYAEHIVAGSDDGRRGSKGSCAGAVYQVSLYLSCYYALLPLLHSHSPSCACNDVLPELEIASSQQIRQACTCVVCYSIITSSQTLKSLISACHQNMNQSCG